MAGEQVVVGVVASYKEALHAVDELRGEGFDDDDISVVARHDEADEAGEADETAAQPPPGEEHGTPGDTPEPESAKNVERGVTTGTVIGGVGGFLAGVGALMIPGIGPILAVGPLLGALGGAALGAATGGLVGVLVDLGVPEEHARHYESRLAEGSVIVTVRTNETRAETASAILRRYEDLAHRVA